MILVYSKEASGIKFMVLSTISVQLRFTLFSISLSSFGSVLFEIALDDEENIDRYTCQEGIMTIFPSHPK